MQNHSLGNFAHQLHIISLNLSAHTTERFFDDDGSVNVEIIYDAEGKAIRQRYLDRAGHEVTSTGEPLPRLPEGVDERARFDAEEERWVYGEGVDGAQPRAGRWTWWTLEALDA